MRAARALLPILVAAAALAPRAAVAGDATGSVLAIPLVDRAGEPGFVLAQRSIDRAWGPSDDSTYVEISVPGWKSEGWAFVFSGAIPGAGHAYLGESSGLLFALIEVAGWTARRQFHHRAHRLRNDGLDFVGSPADTNARWSFHRWEERTGGDASELRALFAADPQAFYARIARDPALVSGWLPGPAPPRDKFRNYWDRADGMYERARYSTTILWLNHAVAAFDGLRAARISNLPLRQNLRIRLKTGWRGGAPTLMAALERRF